MSSVVLDIGFAATSVPEGVRKSRWGCPKTIPVSMCFSMLLAALHPGRTMPMFCVTKYMFLKRYRCRAMCRQTTVVTQSCWPFLACLLEEVLSCGRAAGGRHHPASNDVSVYPKCVGLKIGRLCHPMISSRLIELHCFGPHMIQHVLCRFAPSGLCACLTFALQMHSKTTHSFVGDMIVLGVWQVWYPFLGDRDLACPLCSKASLTSGVDVRSFYKASETR